MLPLDDQQQGRARTGSKPSARTGSLPPFVEIETRGRIRAAAFNVHAVGSGPSRAGEPGGGPGVRRSDGPAKGVRKGWGSIVSNRRRHLLARNSPNRFPGAGRRPRAFFSRPGIKPWFAHMANPHVPAVHMNTRFPDHDQALVRRAAADSQSGDFPMTRTPRRSTPGCAPPAPRNDATFYPRFFQNGADEYFLAAAPAESHAGVGGIFLTTISTAPSRERAATLRRQIFRLHAGRRRGIPRRLPPPSCASGWRDAVFERPPTWIGCSNFAGRLRRVVQPALRSRGRLFRPQGPGGNIDANPDEPPALWRKWK